MIAASKGYDEIVDILIDKNIDVNFSSLKGDTALHLAVVNENHKIAQKLLENKARIDAYNDKKETDLILASKNIDMIKILLKFNPKYRNILQW